MKRVSVIGAGNIGAAVVAYLRDAPDWILASVLVRKERQSPGVELTTDSRAFFAKDTDLIIDAAGPDALRSHGEQALAHADLWTVSATALADPAFRQHLAETARSAGYRLRVLPGAIGGLDAVSALARDPSLRLHIEATRPGPIDTPTNIFSGSATQTSGRYGNMLNVAAAAALAGPGLDATSVTLRGDPNGRRHHLGVRAESSYGRLSVDIDLPLDVGASGHNPVSACIIAALVRETQTIWVG